MPIIQKYMCNRNSLSKKLSQKNSLKKILSQKKSEAFNHIIVNILLLAMLNCDYVTINVLFMFMCTMFIPGPITVVKIFLHLLST